MVQAEKRKFIMRLARVRALIIKKYPFFGNMVMNLSFGIDEDAGTAYTDMKHVIFDPEFVSRLSDDELEFILMHEVMHCVLKHPVRGRGLINRLYNIACDIVVNSNILGYMNVKDFVIDGQLVMHLTPSEKEGRDFTAEDVYTELLSNADRVVMVFDGDGNVDTRLFGDIDILDSHDNWTLLDTDATINDMWDKRLDDYGSKYGYNLGLFPKSVRKLLEEKEVETEINWKELLRRFVDSYIDITDYSYSPPDRRFNDLDYFLPGENTFQEMNGTQDIWFCIDTSGSISVAELTRLFNEVKNVIEQCPGTHGMLSFFDTDITEPVSFYKSYDFDDIRPTGGGGTNFNVIFDYMKENMLDHLPKAIVVLTDGYAPNVPQEKALGIPVMWILIDNNEIKPWGETIHIKT